MTFHSLKFFSKPVDLFVWSRVQEASAKHVCLDIAFTPKSQSYTYEILNSYPIFLSLKKLHHVFLKQRFWVERQYTHLVF